MEGATIGLKKELMSGSLNKAAGATATTGGASSSADAAPFPPPPPFAGAAPVAGSRVCAKTVLRLRPDMVYIGRGDSRKGWPTSKWANPFKIEAGRTRTQAVAEFASHLASSPELLQDLSELWGKTLVRHCDVNEECHGDVLLEFHFVIPGGLDEAIHRANECRLIWFGMCASVANP